MTWQFTLTGLLVAGCDDGSTASSRGCNATNTTLAPADGLIKAFSIPGSGVMNGVVAGPATAAPTFTTDGALRIEVNTPVLSTTQLFGVHYGFPTCIDASAFTGVQASISGSISGCTFGGAIQDSAHQPYGGPSDSFGTGDSTAAPNSTALAADQITSTPQTVQLPFASQSMGVPATPTDSSKITDVAWVFLVEPRAVGGPTDCKADLTLADIKFY